MKEMIELIDIAEIAERKIGRDYPRACALKNYLINITKETKPIKIKKLTEEFDSYIKQGLGWVDDKIPELEPAIQVVYNYAIEKRKTVFVPITDTPALNKLIVFIKDREFEPYKSICLSLINFKNTLNNPSIYGLYEETEFATPQQEAKWQITQIKRKFEKDVFGMSEKMELLVNNFSKEKYPLILKPCIG